MNTLKKITKFLCLWFVLALAGGLPLGIYGRINNTVIADMTYGYVVWAALAVTIVVWLVFFRKSVAK